VDIPLEIKKEEVNYWLHPKIEGRIGIKKDYKGIIAYVGNIPSHQWVEVRIIFPRSYLTNLDPSKVQLISQNGREKIIKEEENWRKQEGARLEIINLLKKIFIFIFIF
ncbi:MAG: DUF2207 domain-containing protein, partial [bacterium]